MGDLLGNLWNRSGVGSGVGSPILSGLGCLWHELVHNVLQEGRREGRVPHGHRYALVSKRVLNRSQAYPGHCQSRSECVTEIVPVEITEFGCRYCLLEPITRPSQRLTREIPNNWPCAVATLPQVL